MGQAVSVLARTKGSTRDSGLSLERNKSMRQYAITTFYVVFWTFVFIIANYVALFIPIER